ncbi:hypothetical protein [Agromyces sp. NPDC058104]|uniref:hypothetical protein n=1 Tax=Agromyces sp. NPDC058104 TaxID=3346342 RepID=UPI0036DB9A28
MTVDQYLINRAAADLPRGGAPTLTHSRPGLRARSAAHAAYKAAEQHVQNVVAASKYTSDDIAAEVLPDLRAGLTDRLKNDLADQFTNPGDGLRRQAERARDEADRAAEKYRPRLDPDSTSQLARTDQAWNNTIRPALEDGKGWDQIIPTLDVDGLLAVERFAPGYEARTRDRFHQHEVPASLAGIKAMSERRLPDALPAEGRAALREHADTVRALEFIDTVMRWSADATPREAVAVEIGLKRGAFAIGAQVPVDTSPEAQQSYAAGLTA